MWETGSWLNFDLIDSDGCVRDNGSILLNPNEIGVVEPNYIRQHHLGAWHGVRCGSKITMRNGMAYRVSEEVQQIKDEVIKCQAAQGV